MKLNYYNGDRLMAILAYDRQISGEPEVIGKIVANLYQDAIDWDKAKDLGLRCIPYANTIAAGILREDDHE